MIMHLYMLVEKSSFKSLSLEEVAGKVLLVEVLDLSVEELKSKCSMEDPAECLGGVLIVYTKDVESVREAGCRVLDVFEIGDGLNAVVTEAQPGCVAVWVKNTNVVKIERSRELETL